MNYAEFHGQARGYLRRNELQIEEFDVEASVNYCMYFMVNAYKLWHEVKLKDKIKFQEMIFPEGVSYEYSKFGTAKTAHIYRLKQLIAIENYTKSPPVGIEPTLTP